MQEMLGIIGGILIIIAWLYETLRDFKKQKTSMDIKYIFISLVGTIFLFTYSFFINNIIFMMINFILFILIVLEIIISVTKKRK